MVVVSSGLRTGSPAGKPDGDFGSERVGRIKIMKTNGY